MNAIDSVLGLDWSEDTTYIGDGVYLKDATPHIGIPSVAVRTDRGDAHHVIVFEDMVFRDLVKRGTAIIAAWTGNTEISEQA